MWFLFGDEVAKIAKKQLTEQYVRRVLKCDDMFATTVTQKLGTKNGGRV